MRFLVSVAQLAPSATLFLLVANTLYKRMNVPNLTSSTIGCTSILRKYELYGIRYAVYGWFLVWKPPPCMSTLRKLLHVLWSMMLCSREQETAPYPLIPIHGSYTVLQYQKCTRFCWTNASRGFVGFNLTSLRRLNCLQISPFREFLVTYIPQTREEAAHRLEVSFVDSQFN